MQTVRRTPPLDLEWEHIAHLHDMMRFHLRPNARTFNRIIALECNTVWNDETADAEPEFVQYEGETDEEASLRKYNVWKSQQNRAVAFSVHMIYSDPYILAWAHAAITAFPELSLFCNFPLVIDRATRFYANTLSNLQCADEIEEFDVVRYGASGNTRYLGDITQHIGETTFATRVLRAYYDHTTHSARPAEEIRKSFLRQ